jgi:DNA-binding MarR family transcriptional regulator
MHLDKSTTSRVVQALVRKGYAEHAPEAGDRRAVAIAATRSGRRLYDRITKELIEQQKLVIEGLEPKVRRGAIEIIRRLVRAAEARILCGPGPDEGTCCGPVAGVEE